ncbi:MAG TPA: hypothetical protein ENI62_15695, partial [Gammaproteobacteria bacterium]|nr:hypothetical protein [Gammaproteobacteria bacterium]
MKNHADNEQTIAAAGRLILKQILANYQGSVVVKLWDGELVVGHSDAPCTVIFNQPSVLRQLVLYRNIVHLAEDYLAEKVDIEGDVEYLFDLVSYMQDLALSWSTRLRLLRQAFRLPRHRREKSAQAIRAGNAQRRNTKQSIAYHYDVGNDFYR